MIHDVQVLKFRHRLRGSPMTEPIGDKVVIYCRDLQRLDTDKAVEHARATYRAGLDGIPGELSGEQLENVLGRLMIDLSELTDMREKHGCWFLPIYPTPIQPSVFLSHHTAYGALWIEERGGHQGIGVVAGSLNWERDDAV